MNKNEKYSNRNGASNYLKNNNSNKIVILLLLTAIIIAVYSQVKDHEFVYDDHQYVTQNKHVTSEFTGESVLWAFTSSRASHWHPITWLSHMLDYQAYGLNPKGHHLTSLGFHIANSLLLFLILSQMTGSLGKSGFIATMFAIHPLNVESVAWVSDRKNVLSTFFWLLTMWAYVRYTKFFSIKKYSLVIFFFALGLMSKPMLVTLPFVLLMMDYWPLGRMELRSGKMNERVMGNSIENKLSISRLFQEKIPLFILTIGSAFMTVIASKKGGALQNMESTTLSSRLNNAMVSYLDYLKKTIWPENLSILYPHPGNELSAWKGILCAIALVSVSVVAIKLIRRAPYFAFGWFWYLGTLLPVIQIAQTGFAAMADRYTYIPLIGIFIIIAWGLPDLISKWRYRNMTLTILAGIVIPLLMVVTWKQVNHWKNSITVFTHAVEVTDKKYPDFAPAHYNLGLAFSIEGKEDEAVHHFKKAINLWPNYTDAYINLAFTLSNQGKTKEAISYYKKVLKSNPDLPIPHNSLGHLLFIEKRKVEAVDHLKKAIQLKPDFALAYDNLGVVLFSEGKINEAIPHFLKAIKLKPDFALAYDHFGSVLFSLKKFDDANLHYRMAIQIKPDLYQAHNNLGNSLYRQRKIEEAIPHFRQAIKLKPDYTQAQENLQNALNELENLEKQT